MEPRLKAKELVDKMENPLNGVTLFKELRKSLALIAVDEIINSNPSLPILGDGGTYGEDIELSTKYWQDVKKEIENL